MSAHGTLVIAPQVPSADINDDPYFRRLVSLAFKRDALSQELAKCVNDWHQRNLDRYRRAPPGVGLSNDRLLDLATLASLTGDSAKIIDFARSVLSAATHPNPLFAAAQRTICAEGTHNEN